MYAGGNKRLSHLKGNREQHLGGAEDCIDEQMIESVIQSSLSFPITTPAIEIENQSLLMGSFVHGGFIVDVVLDELL